ncbi:MAG: class I SAM-dependent methyltransferase [Acidimicrobiia bacterium]
MNREETDRVRRVYEGYDRDARRRARYDSTRAGNQAMVSERWRVIDGLLRLAGVSSLSGRRILEVGCGDGANVDPLIAAGAGAESLTGVDLSFPRLISARRAHPDMSCALATGETLPFPPAAFDAVVLFTVLSSILDTQVARGIARESGRVLRAGGIVLWYDLRVGNPRNANVRGVRRGELEGFFPGFDCQMRSVTVVPPLARALGPAARWLYPVLGFLPPLRSHYAAVLTKMEAA